MGKSEVVTFTAPRELKEILDAVSSVGYYDSLSEFMRDAVRSYFASHKGFAALVAFHLWKAKKISIGKAGVMMNASPEEVEEWLKRLEC